MSRSHHKEKDFVTMYGKQIFLLSIFIVIILQIYTNIILLYNRDYKILYVNYT